MMSEGFRFQEQCSLLSEQLPTRARSQRWAWDQLESWDGYVSTEAKLIFWNQTQPQGDVQDNNAACAI